MKKKESFWDKITVWHILLFIIIVGSIIFVISLFITYDDFYCQQNPSECVCEEWECTYDYDIKSEIVWNSKYSNCRLEKYKTLTYTPSKESWKYIKSKCLSYRKLTPAELLEQDCKNNPREDGDCKCLEYEIKQMVNYSVVDRQCVPITISNEEKTTINVNIEVKEEMVDIDEMREQYKEQTKGMTLAEKLTANIEFEVGRPMRDIPIYFNEDQTMCLEFGGEYEYAEIDGKRIEPGNLTDLFYYETTDECILARPKTECEKMGC